jgi:hypothetical protein
MTTVLHAQKCPECDGTQPTDAAVCAVCGAALSGKHIVEIKDGSADAFERESSSISELGGGSDLKSLKTGRRWTFAAGGTAPVAHSLAWSTRTGDGAAVTGPGKARSLSPAAAARRAELEAKLEALPRRPRPRSAPAPAGPSAQDTVTRILGLGFLFFFFFLGVTNSAIAGVVLGLLAATALALIPHVRNQYRSERDREAYERAIREADRCDAERSRIEASLRELR